MNRATWVGNSARTTSASASVPLVLACLLVDDTHTSSHLDRPLPSAPQHHCAAATYIVRRLCGCRPLRPLVASVVASHDVVIVLRTCRRRTG
jgi:hypothetical protein